ncbi:CWF complex protein sap62 [Oleoguttula sp. CCFEE 5521]
MDYQNRAGSKFGGGGVASQSASNADRRERLRKLALETIDLDKDPYFFKNHVGSFECRLCLTVHQNDGSYLAHTQGRKHQTNLARRAAKDAAFGKAREGDAQFTGANAVQVRKNTVKIGRPGYKITKTKDPLTRQQGLTFQLQYPEISPGVIPRVRFMSAYEQKIEDPPDKAFQYLLVAAEPYETCGFKVQARDVDRREDKFWSWWDADSREFWVQVTFKTDREERYSGVPGLGGGGGRGRAACIGKAQARNVAGFLMGLLRVIAVASSADRAQASSKDEGTGGLIVKSM